MTHKEEPYKIKPGVIRTQAPQNDIAVIYFELARSSSYRSTDSLTNMILTPSDILVSFIAFVLNLIIPQQ